MTAPQLQVLATAELAPALLAEVRALCADAFPAGDFADSDWRSALGGTSVLVAEGGTVLAHAAVVPRLLTAGGTPLPTGYLEAVAVRPDRQGAGLGSAVVEVAGAVVRDRYALGALSTGRWSFYERLGWERWRGATWVLRDGARVRTPEDDDGVLVLRTPRTPAGLDPTADLVAEDRPGDVW